MASRKIVLVTGANSGIGYEIAKALWTSTAQPYHVLVGCRTASKATAAVESIRASAAAGSDSTLEPLELDLTQDQTISAAAAHVSAAHARLDCLVNNAGVNLDVDHVRGKLTPREQFQGTFDVNVSGTHVVTHAFAPLLLRSSDPRLIFVSGLASLTKQAERYFPTPDLPAGWPKEVDYLETVAYKCSKVALSMLMLDWRHRLKADGVKVWALAPGMCATNLGGLSKEEVEKMGAQHPEAAGRFVRDVVEGARDQDQGKIVSRDGGMVAW